MEDVGEETAECAEGRVDNDLNDESFKRVFIELSTKTKPKLKAKINSKRSRTWFEIYGSQITEYLPLGLNIENRIAEDEKLRNLSLKKLVNSKSNDRTTKREAKASEINESIHILRDVDHKLSDNGEFDPGSGRTLAACFIHASRTRSYLRVMESGGRVSNM